jgi:hypothetical protein
MIPRQNPHRIHRRRKEIRHAQKLAKRFAVATPKRKKRRIFSGARSFPCVLVSGVFRFVFRFELRKAGIAANILPATIQSTRRMHRSALATLEENLTHPDILTRRQRQHFDRHKHAEIDASGPHARFIFDDRDVVTGDNLIACAVHIFGFDIHLVRCFVHAGPI